jgi:pyroglutamyl-peptidase
MPTILITGFGPFPGAPHNPTGALAARLATARRSNLRLVAHVFATRYDAVDLELPALIDAHRPDALLMFGLHNRAHTLRVETIARNALSRQADAGGIVPQHRRIEVNGADHVRMISPALRLVHAARRAGAHAMLSRDAGAYLCNYLCWRATARVGAPGPRLAAFVHVPPTARGSRRGALGPAMLEQAAAAMLGELILCLGAR